MNQSKPQRKLSVVERANMLKNAFQLPGSRASNEQSQKKEDTFKSRRKTIKKMLENRGGANVPNNSYEDSGEEEEVSSMSSFGNDEV